MLIWSSQAGAIQQLKLWWKFRIGSISEKYYRQPVIIANCKTTVIENVTKSGERIMSLKGSVSDETDRYTLSVVVSVGPSVQLAKKTPRM
jgi:hypothetical protein